MREYVGIMKLRRFVKTHDEPEYIEVTFLENTEEEFVMRVYQNINCESFTKLIRDVEDGVFLNIDGVIEYAPQNYDFMFRQSILSYMTNVKIPDEFEFVWDLCFNETFWNKVVTSIPADVYNRIENTCRDYITYKRELRLSEGKYNTEKIMSELNSYIDLMNAVNERFDGIDIRKFADGVEHLTDNTNINDVLNVIKIVDDK